MGGNHFSWCWPPLKITQKRILNPDNGNKRLPCDCMRKPANTVGILFKRTHSRQVLPMKAIRLQHVQQYFSHLVGKGWIVDVIVQLD